MKTENLKTTATILGVAVLLPVFPLLIAADLARNAVRKAKDSRENILGEAEITESIERKIFGDM